jgi:hypothetical protein
MLEALLRSQSILERYIQPGKRDCESAVNELLTVLDDEKLLIAMNQARLRKLKAVLAHASTSASCLATAGSPFAILGMPR